MKTANNCYQARTGEVERRWYVVDASQHVLGRMCTRLAGILAGKNKPTYTPHIDTGDFVIVLNADKVQVSGSKKDDVVFQYYTGYPSGRKVIPMKDLLLKNPESVIFDTVRRMMPKSALTRHMLTKLKIYRGDAHPHQAQNPEPLALQE